MIIVADAGSTKTDWRILEGTDDTVIRTSGINPAIMSESQICDILKKSYVLNWLKVAFFPKGVTADIGVTILRYIIMEPDVPSRTCPK